VYAFPFGEKSEHGSTREKGNAAGTAALFDRIVMCATTVDESNPADRYSRNFS
jgi:hypothetical protein